MRRGLALAVLLLGAGHVIYGVAAFPSLSSDFVWFQGAGVAMLLAGVVNFDRRLSRVAACAVNGAMAVYFGAAAAVLPLPQVWIGLGLFAALTVLSVVGLRPRRAA